MRYIQLILLLLLASCAGTEESGRAITKVTHPSHIIVAPGDNLEKIANQYSVKIADLMKENYLKPGAKLKTGQKIILPKHKYWVVKKGDTIALVAKKFDVDIGLIASFNRIKYPFKLKVGSTLKIPANKTYKKEQDALAKIDNNTYDAVEVPAIKEKPVLTTKEKLSTKETIAVASKYIWPIEGKVVAYYGANDGIEIASFPNVLVKSMAQGKVAYSGKGPDGYGNLLIIKHDGDIFSAYAHLGEMLVKDGQDVSSAQEIARLANSKDAANPQLYFAIRQGQATVDPLLYLPKIK